MPRIRDVQDAVLAEEFTRLEAQIDNAEFTDVVHGCAALYVGLVVDHPNLIPLPPEMGALPTGGRGFPAAVQHRPWPELTGVAMRTESGKPEMIFNKASYTMSDALTCFEYTLETAVLAQSL